MFLTNIIVGTFSPHGFWHLLFSAISLLGLYLSLTLLIRDRCKGRQRTFLGLYLVSLSILLLYMSIHAPVGYAENALFNAFGLMPLFLIGPFSYKLRQGALTSRTRSTQLFQFIPAAVIGICVAAGWLSISTVYILGIFHVGSYLVLQSFRKAQKGILDGQHVVVQLTLFLGLSVLCLAFRELNPYFIASVGLTMLILHIWMRLLYAAYISYLISRS